MTEATEELPGCRPGRENPAGSGGLPGPRRQKWEFGETDSVFTSSSSREPEVI